MNEQRLDNLIESIGKLTGRLDAFSETITTKFAEHDERITKVETTQWKWAGAIGLCVFVAPLIVKYLL